MATKKSDSRSPETPRGIPGGKGAWRLMDRGSSVVAGALAGTVSAALWRGVTGRKPPVNGRHPDVSTGEAVAWAMIGGGLIELVKVGVRRWTALYWVRSTGELPPGMKPLEGRALLQDAEKPAPGEPASRRASRVSRRSRGR